MTKLKSALFVLLLAITLPLAAKEYKYETVPGDLMATRIYKLDNGLTVYLSVNNEKPRIPCEREAATTHLKRQVLHAILSTLCSREHGISALRTRPPKPRFLTQYKTVSRFTAR